LFCSECGTKLADDWTSCPKCGTEVMKTAITKKAAKNSPEKPLSLLISQICGVIILFIFLSFVFTSCFSSKPSTPSPTKQSQVRQILLTAGFERGFIVIRNDNDFDWENAQIVVANGITKQFTRGVGTIRQGETKSFSLSEFVDSNGERYDSRKYIPKQVLIYADNASGGKQY
jgi:Predicted membrane protein